MKTKRVAKKKSAMANAAIRPRIRVYCGRDIALGPGKAELLVRVRETGSLREAAQRMGMSYMRAWLLVRQMNRCFRKPVVRSVRGGRGGGGARLTSAGQRALELYLMMEKKSSAAVRPLAGRLRRLLKS